MHFFPDDIQVKHVLQAVERIEHEKIDLRPSTRWNVVINGKLYPPKEIMRYAHEQANGVCIWNYGGGEPTNKYLKTMGFEILDKPSLSQQFTWLPFYKKLTDYLARHINNHEGLISLLRNAGVKLPMDQDPKGNQIPFGEIDPITFLSMINKYGQEKRIQIMNAISDELGFSVIVVDDNGLPRSNPQKSWRFPYKYLRVNDEIKRLGDFFLQAMEDRITNESFVDILKVKNIAKASISEALFYIDPARHFPLNGSTIPFLEEELNIDSFFESYDDYLRILDKIKIKSNKSFYEISYEALQYSEKTDLKLFQDVVERLNQRKFDQYISIVRQIFLENSIEKNSRAYALTVIKSDNRLAFHIGNQYVLTIQDKEGETTFGPTLNRKLSSFKSKYGQFEDGSYWNDVEEIEPYIDDVKAFCKRRFERGHLANRSDANNSAFVDHIFEGLQKSRYKEAYIDWLKTSSGKHRNTQNSYIQAIEILSVNLNWDIFSSSDVTRLEKLYQDLIKHQGDKESKYHYPKAPSYGEKGFFSASINSYLEFIHQLSKASDRPMKPKNIIYYGPPGTGKTYYLKSDLIPKYTVKTSSLSEQEFFEEVAATLDWWESCALALLEGGDATVPELVSNRWLDVRINNSSSQNPNATIWGNLQAHTIAESTEVNVQKRRKPQVFDKKSGSKWTVLEDNLREQAPHIIEILEEVKKFKPGLDQEIRRYDFVTFHQSFSYEDFVEGIKPVMAEGDIEGEVTYEISPGVFKRLCDRASADNKNRYAIFIDEINRGNIAAIFGELITLIETDKRGGSFEVKLPYSKKPFHVPSNLDIYGTMNTADRSVEALDTALRRRFQFVEMPPLPEILHQGKAAKEPGNISPEYLMLIMDTLNLRIERLLDKDHKIGHSYFMDINSMIELKEVFKLNIIPLLQEYFFGDYGKIGLILGSDFFSDNLQGQDEDIFAEFDYDSLSSIVKPVFKLKDLDKVDESEFASMIDDLLKIKR